MKDFKGLCERLSDLASNIKEAREDLLEPPLFVQRDPKVDDVVAFASVKKDKVLFGKVLSIEGKEAFIKVEEPPKGEPSVVTKAFKDLKVVRV